MSKEPYKFDENFVKILLTGTRRDFAIYRNCLIDEMDRRKKHTDAESVRKMVGETVADTKKSRKRHFVGMIIFSLMIVISIIILKKCSHNMIIVIVSAFTILFNTLNLVLNGANFLCESYLLEKYKEAVIVVEKTSRMIEYPEVFKIISNDTKEMLSLKKEKLDEILGF